MGCLPSKDDLDKEAVQVSKNIDKQLKLDATASTKNVKLLLLGAGESGKSTIAKQLRILHKEGFSEQERLSYKQVVYTNVIQSMVSIITAMEKLDIGFENTDRIIDANKVRSSYLNDADISSDIGEALERLWADGGVRKCFERSSGYQLNDSAKYYFDNLDRLCQDDYVPTEQDVLRSRVQTTGIQETHFEYKNLDFTLIDVGGQRTERKKWIHCFQDVTAIIFCVAMSAYDQVLDEDGETNRMKESLKLFESICNNPFFVDTAMILFLNKKDLFEEKIEKYPLTTCFADFKGQSNYSEASMYIRQQFEALNLSGNRKTREREIYTHFTCATDTTNVRFVFDVVSDVLVSSIVNNIFGPN